MPGLAAVSNQWRKLVPVLLLALPLVSAVRQAHASDAEDAWRRGDYLQAAELYHEALKKQPDDPKLHYNLGTAAYRNNLYDEAAAAFAEALKSDDLQLQQMAYYNRGNALYQKGMESLQANPQATRDKWQEALQAYDGAIALAPDDVQARENREFVARQLEELAQNEQQSKDNSGQNQQDQQQSSDQDQQNPEKSDQQQEQQGPASNDTQAAEQPRPDEGDEAAKDSRQPNKESGPAEQPQSEPGEKQQPAESGEEQRQAAAADQESEHDRDMERRSLGKMTREEAQNLLNALKNEEGELNFVPSGRGQDQSVRRDW